MTISVLLPNKNEKNVQAFMQEIEDTIPQVSQIICCVDREGKGKGWAVREALKLSTGSIICFLDADGDISPKMIRRLIPFLADYDIVVGIKAPSGHYTRRILTWASRLYITLFFGVRVNTQTGIKLFKREAISDWYSNSWLFDLEILALANKDGYKMIEVPIEATVSKKMKFSSVWKTLKESWTLWLELR